MDDKSVVKTGLGVFVNIFLTVGAIALYIVKMFLLIISPIIYAINAFAYIALIFNTLCLLPCLHPADFTYSESILIEVVLIAVLAICSWVISDVND